MLHDPSIVLHVCYTTDLKCFASCGTYVIFLNRTLHSEQQEHFNWLSKTHKNEMLVLSVKLKQLERPKFESGSCTD